MPHIHAETKETWEVYIPASEIAEAADIDLERVEGYWFTIGSGTCEHVAASVAGSIPGGRLRHRRVTVSEQVG